VRENNLRSSVYQVPAGWFVRTCVVCGGGLQSTTVDEKMLVVVQIINNYKIL
jgi:hypothetical protein